MSANSAAFAARLDGNSSASTCCSHADAETSLAVVFRVMSLEPLGGEAEAEQELLSKQEPPSKSETPPRAVSVHGAKVLAVARKNGW
ncbi:unnamed protein product [Miscanthus lutarioriparius]|uniref:Uncharacterized protein n=1 Tax=Miscanthus lutarioriparius TaxID=422564 RepID=A0A811S100_9POAL|nr:unnamed protein product [Miscanthus lutarioriparius]